MMNKLRSYHWITREELERKKLHSTNLNLISLDWIEIEQLWVPMQVAQIIAFVWNQNLSKYWIKTDEISENAEEILQVLENALDIYNIFCWDGRDFSKLEELEQNILIYAWKSKLLGDDISMDLEKSICPAEVAKCVSHYINYDFEDFHDYTSKLIQEKLW